MSRFIRTILSNMNDAELREALEVQKNLCAKSLESGLFHTLESEAKIAGEMKEELRRRIR